MVYRICGVLHITVYHAFCPAQFSKPEKGRAEEWIPPLPSVRNHAVVYESSNGRHCDLYSL
ncbi:hypothetical protein CNEO_140015 [Clostridium neonatale]|nr:hypothetical protein CNEO_140015 [Clostridium neonatale]